MNTEINAGMKKENHIFVSSGTNLKRIKPKRNFLYFQLLKMLLTVSLRNQRHCKVTVQLNVCYRRGWRVESTRAIDVISRSCHRANYTYQICVFYLTEHTNISLLCPCSSVSSPQLNFEIFSTIKIIFREKNNEKNTIR